MAELVKHPCQGCIYFAVCGEHTRTEPCKGRKTKSEVKKEKALSNAATLRKGEPRQ